MKRFILFLVIICTLGIQAKSQRDSTIVVSADKSTTWVIMVEKQGDREYNITALGRANGDKALSEIAGMILDEAYGVTVAPGTAKEKGGTGSDIALTKKIYVKGPGKYVLTGSVSWYMQGEKDVRKKNFTLVFRK
jgi:hypothetical protein